MTAAAAATAMAAAGRGGGDLFRELAGPARVSTGQRGSARVTPGLLETTAERMATD